MTKKIAFIIQGGTDKFLAPVRNWVSDRFEFREINGSDTDGVNNALEWADLTWVEWVQDAAVRVSHLKRRGKLIMRLHGFEAYTSLPADVAWQNVDALMVVSQHMTDILRLRIPDIEQRTEVFVLPNGVDTTLFNAPKKKHLPGKSRTWGSCGTPRICRSCCNALPRPTGTTPRAPCTWPENTPDRKSK